MSSTGETECQKHSLVCWILVPMLLFSLCISVILKPVDQTKQMYSFFSGQNNPLLWYDLDLKQHSYRLFLFNFFTNTTSSKPKQASTSMTLFQKRLRASVSLAHASFCAASISLVLVSVDRNCCVLALAQRQSVGLPSVNWNLVCRLQPSLCAASVSLECELKLM